MPSGTPNVRGPELIQSRVVKDEATGCWIWQKFRNADGYGRTGIDGKGVQAHRLAYEIFVGPIPAGLTIDHLCRNRACVNPEHLEPVTNRENILRGETITGIAARKTHCKYGHELSGYNLIVRHKTKAGHRECRQCARERYRRFWRRQADAKEENRGRTEERLT